jgi:AraC-like DNA-binding protein
MKNPLVRYILGVVERYGLPSDEVLTRWRLETNRSNEPNSDDLAPLFRAMASLRPEDADLGLHVGECVPLQAFNPVIYLVLSSASLARSIGAAIRFGEVLEGRASKMWTRPRGDAQIVGWSELAPDGHEDRHHHEFIAVALVKAFAFLRGEPATLAAVQFQHDHPGGIDEHLRVFGLEPTFAHPDHSALVVPKSVWTSKTAHADPDVERMHEAMLEQAKARIQRSDVEQRARAEVRARLADGASMAAVAKALALSDRSLQRRLKEAGTSYRQLVDEVRREVVLEQLRTTDTSVEAIALAAGFTDASSLHRAFTRWTGKTPHAMRLELRDR